MEPDLPPFISGLVKTKYKTAKAAQELVFSQTELSIIHTSTGVPFQLRFCPSLGQKPQPKKNPAPQTPKPDPFDNPSPSLLITALPPAPSDPTHNLILNKFPIIAEHFILATKTNKPQTHFLEDDDLLQTITCLWDWEKLCDPHKRLFAFFNSGDHSGASQPHRHLQFLPVESMMTDVPEESSWRLLIDSMTDQESEPVSPGGLRHNLSLPFVHFAIPISPQAPKDILGAYQSLYTAAHNAVEDYISANPNTLDLHPTDGDNLPISYNLAMTTKTIAIMPRRSEGSMLHRDDGSELGLIALNGTTLGGTLMVKHQEQWDELRAKPWKLDKILADIGIPRPGLRNRDGETSAPSL